MTNCVYKIEFYKSTLDLNDDYDRLSEYEKECISELNADSFFDYEDELERYTCYLITTPSELERYTVILKNNLIKHDYFNLSKSLLKNEIDLEDLEEKIDEINYFKYDFFMDDIDNWILHNLDIDTVLDRINSVGIESLKPIETKFLKNYKI
jgi:hypothetical protein